MFIVKITIYKISIVTTSKYIYTTNLTFNICTFKFSFFITGFVIKVLGILKHTGIFPAIIHLTLYPDTRTQLIFITFFTS